jgi:mannosyl-oligosaccharide alpha-1,2-mannosidase
LKAFKTPNMMPVAHYKWKDTSPLVAPEAAFISEIASLSLEFTRLAQLTGQIEFFTVVQRISLELRKVRRHTKIPGLWPAVVNMKDLKFDGEFFTLGAWADSMYEYLPKEFMLLDGKDPDYLLMYERAYYAMKENHFFRAMIPTDDDLLFVGSVNVSPAGNRTLKPEVQHLGCFVGGMIAIGSRLLHRPEQMEFAARVTDGCVWSYSNTATGIMPEIFNMLPCEGKEQCSWNETAYNLALEDALKADEPSERQKVTPKSFLKIHNKRYLLRPEAIESVFIMYRITGDVAWQEKGWKMFQAIKNYTQTPIAFSEIDDVTDEQTSKSNRMESFFLAETLKYFYLLFSEPHVVSLDEYVL